MITMEQPKAIRKSICLGPKTLKIAQKHADDFYCGNLSAFLASRVLEFDEHIRREQMKAFSGGSEVVFANMGNVATEDSAKEA